MYSMTGYGRGEYKENGVELTVEIKTVNNRYLDAVIKAPRIFAAPNRRRHWGKDFLFFRPRKHKLSQFPRQDKYFSPYRAYPRGKYRRPRDLLSIFPALRRGYSLRARQKFSELRQKNNGSRRFKFEKRTVLKKMRKIYASFNLACFFRF